MKNTIFLLFGRISETKRYNVSCPTGLMLVMHRAIQKLLQGDFILIKYIIKAFQCFVLILYNTEEQVHNTFLALQKSIDNWAYIALWKYPKHKGFLMLKKIKAQILLNFGQNHPKLFGTEEKLPKDSWKMFFQIFVKNVVLIDEKNEGGDCQM